MNTEEKPKLVRPKVAKILYIVAGVVFLNILISIFLTYEFYYPELGEVCDLNDTFSCIKVSQSEYAVLFGMPVAIWGIAFYSFLFVLLFGSAINFRFSKIHKRLRPGTILNIARYLTYFGLLFSLYLTYVEAFVIYSFCIFCVAQQIFIIALVALQIWTHKIIEKGKEETKVCEFC